MLNMELEEFYIIREVFTVMDIRPKDVIVEIDWLKCYNLEID